MNPIQISQDLQTTLRSYIMTLFDVNRDGKNSQLSRAIEASLDATEALSKGPYLEIAPPYREGSSIEHLITEDILSPKWRTKLSSDNLPLPLDAPLYQHQMIAIQKLVSEKRNIVVSSGTGSGKTESFLIPILNDLLLDSSPGVRAVLIYPLNALVNDQLERLRRLLKDTNITFGRYTSELDYKLKDARQKYPDAPENEIISREQIRQNGEIPQILITNYAMLEYLLLRPEDSPLFQSGKWRYIVLDEAHTYAGAQGFEVSMLLKRLKHRLNKSKGDVQCIATSATLTSDDVGQAKRFASRLFDENFSDDDIIFGETTEDLSEFIDSHYEFDSKNYLRGDFSELIDELRKQLPNIDEIALLMEDLGLIPKTLDWGALVNTVSPQQFVWDVMRRNTHLAKIRRLMNERQNTPMSLEELAERTFENENMLPEEQREAIHRLIELGTFARKDPKTSSLLPTRYHFFMRSPQGIYVCLNPHCTGRTNTDLNGKWSKIFAHARERCDACESLVFPIHICRDCGQTFLPISSEENNVKQQRLGKANTAENAYYVWEKYEENSALTDEITNEDEISTTPIVEFTQEEKKLCVRCGSTFKPCKCKPGENIDVTLYAIMRNERNKGAQPYTEMDKCPRCHSEAKEGSKIATPIALRGTAPLSTLTYSLYRELPASNNEEKNLLPGNGRKLLTFYDSRQGAARFASYLQHAVTSENYQHIIPLALKEFATKNKSYLPSIDILAKEVTEIALRYGIFHNDPDSKLWRTKLKTRPSRQDIEKLETGIKTQIIAELSVRRSRRQSLESLGLVAIEYFDEENTPDFAKLANQLHLTPKQAEVLVIYLLDDLRSKKILEFPDDVEANNEAFGLYEGHPRIVRGDANPKNHQQPWIGKTERQQRRRYIERVLKANKLPSDTKTVEDALRHIFDWLKDAELLVGTPQLGFRVAINKISLSHKHEWSRCYHCQCLNAHYATNLPCPRHNCLGELKPIDNLDKEIGSNFFYQSFSRNVVPLRVEEHTAQLKPEKGREYQEAFKDGYINVLSCSTTFEMGIDLGDLQAVVMSNVPPAVANYRQRAGRAGRRVSGTAFILTWASDKPHDQTYFRQPQDMIKGHIRVPHIPEDNVPIKERHQNAVLLSDFLRYIKDEREITDWKSLGEFFDPYGNPHITQLKTWKSEREKQIIRLLERFESNPADKVLAQFLQAMERVKEAYEGVIKNYRDRINELTEQISAINNGIKKGSIKDLNEEVGINQRLIDRLQKKQLIDHLSEQGVLPSYSFPLDSVELQLFDEKAESLRLQRDLKLAIREYAPGAEIVADKRVWKSEGVRFKGSAPQIFEYHICPFCNHLEIATAPKLPLNRENKLCPICQQKVLGKQGITRQYLQPDGFISFKKGKPARQYIVPNASYVRSAMLPADEFEEEALGELLTLGYNSTGQLLYVNEGDVKSDGFHIHLDGARAGLTINDKKDKTSPLSLGYRRTTDSLRIRFQSTDYIKVPSPDDASFWLSLMYALLNGASRALQIERDDIDGLLFPRAGSNHIGWEQTIVLYDNVPGGAGHVRQIQLEFEHVLEETLKIVNCTDCAEDTSCYHCLRSYGNQHEHDLLKRGKIIRFLEELWLSVKSKDSPTVENINSVITLNRPHWLAEQLINSKSSIQIATRTITLDEPKGSSSHWMDILYDLLRRGIKVQLYLSEWVINRDSPAPNTLSVAQYLLTLIEKGLELYKINILPEWHIVIDAEREERCRAIRIINEEGFALEVPALERTEMLTSLRPTFVAEVPRELNKILKHAYDRKDLMPSSGTTKVINYDPVRSTMKTEKELFGSVFKLAVQSIFINDPYLLDEEQIVHRLGAYLSLASTHSTLKDVVVNTSRAIRINQGSNQKQDSAISKLKKDHPDINIVFKYEPEHDRYIKLTRTDGSLARILIGSGLDFLSSKSRRKKTYIVIEDPLT